MILRPLIKWPKMFLRRVLMQMKNETSVMLRAVSLTNQQRGFKSLNKLHHNKSNSIPFYVAVERVLMVTLPLFLFLMVTDSDYKSSFLGNLLGFKQIDQDLEEEMGIAPARKIKKIQYADELTAEQKKRVSEVFD